MSPGRTTEDMLSNRPSRTKELNRFVTLRQIAGLLSLVPTGTIGHSL